ncbi:MAG: hypothetical protein DYG89_12310 [Caldilinea sp. CFX5]|nr:hypothetical protein [Caldilinea sp. CFX5]
MVNACKRSRRTSFTIALIQVLLLCSSLGTTTPPLYAAPSAPGYLRLIRFMEADQVKLQNPSALQYLAATSTFLVLQEAASARGSQPQVTALTAFEDQLGATTLPQGVDPYNVAYDAKGQRLFFFDAAQGQLRQFAYQADGLPTTPSVKTVALPGQTDAIRGMAIDAAGQTLYLLAADRLEIRRLNLTGDQVQVSGADAIDLQRYGLAQVRGLAVHPQSGHLFTIDPTTRRLYELTTTGALVNYYDLAAAEIADAQGLTFAPSGDKTDDPDQISLYITDRQADVTSTPATANLRPSAYLPLIAGPRTTSSSVQQSHGRVAELTFDPPNEPVMAAATTNVATLVQTIKTYEFTPPSPDPSDIAYISTTPYVLNGERLLISDAEVDEMKLYAGANLFEINFNGVLQRTYTTVTAIRNEITQEPAGLSFNPNNGHLFLCDDDNIRPIIEIAPGPDKIYRTSDDVVTKFSTRQYFNVDDPEGIEYARINNSDWLFLVDGLNSELYMIQPGPNGQFDGVDDVRTQYDTATLGVLDPEGVAYHPHTGTLYLVGKPPTRLTEITLNGALVRYVDISAANARKPAGLAFAPNSQNPNQLSLYIVDRMVDNNSDPKENDGLVYEMSIPAAGNLPPTVEAGVSMTVTLPATATLEGTVTDDGLPNPPATVTASWSKVSGPGTVTFGNANSVDTTANFSLPGDYVLRLTASDSQASNSDTVNVKVVVVNQPPVVNAGPDQAIEVGTLATMAAQVTDDGWPNPPHQVTLTWQKVSGPGTVNFTAPASAATTVSFSALGAYVLRLTANDSVLSASAEVTITVLPPNSAPTVNAGGDQLIGRNDGAALVGTVSDDGLPNPPAQLTVNWEKISGPGAVSFTAANHLTTTATFTALGVYVLRLTVNDGVLSSFDEVTITVGPPNQAPTVNAGADQTIQLTETVTLAGAVSDDGIPNPPGALRVQWQLQSGPGHALFSSPNTLTTTVHFTATGVYVLRLLADDGAKEASDTVTFTVIDASTSYVILGQSQTTEVGKSLTLSATINGPWSKLPPGSLTYQWSQLIGPAPVALGAPTQLGTTAVFTAPGDYLLQLTVSNGNQTISGTVTISVNAINQRPQVNAGLDQTLAAPGALELSATITDDNLPGPAHKLIIQWTRVSGPAEVTFADRTSATTTATFTAVGTYVLKVTAHDGDLIGEDAITVQVGDGASFKLFMPISRK